MHEKPEEKILVGSRVLDLTDEKGALAIKLLAGMGAEVIRIDPENQTERFRELIKTADILIDTSINGVDYQKLVKANPLLIMVSITPYGRSGPYKDLKESDLTLQAMGGWLSVTGTPEQPLKLYGNQAYNTASLFTVNGILLALWDRQKTGRGQQIDISIMDCVAATLDHVLVRYFYDNIVSERQGGRAWNNTFDVLPCIDGYILISIHRQWETLVELMAAEGMADDLAEAEYLDREVRNRHIDHIIEVMTRWTKKHRAEELEELGQLMHFPWAAVR